MTIVLTGGSGFIGTKLAHALLVLGDTVIVVDVVAPNFTHQRLYFIQCDITTTKLPFNVLEQTDAVINLVGAPIFQKWTKGYKQKIVDSRLVSTAHIVESMQAATNRPTILINASAVGYYGDRGSEELTEKSSKGEGFLADMVESWEKAAQQAETFGTRVVCVRTAPVLGHSGIIKAVRKTARWGFLLSLSKHDFWQPWIHEQDIVNAYLFALQTSTLQGVVNAVSPGNVTHAEFMKVVGAVLRRKVLGTLPVAIQKLWFGALIEELTKSRQVLPQRLIDKGFLFVHPTLESALQSTLTKNDHNEETK